MKSNYAIETVNLSKSDKGKHRVKGIHLTVPSNCVYGFLGPNGAGKSTTMKLLLGLIKPTEGEIYILDQKVSSKNQFQINRMTGSLIESPSFYGHLTGQENLEIIARYKGCSPDNITEVLNIVHLYAKKDQKVKQYSLGMKQRLGIAMALLGHPKLLILDEPTNGLDPAGIQEIRELIKTLPQKYGITVLVSSHLLAEIEQMADYVGIINQGNMIYQGEMSELETTGKNLEDIFLTLTGGNEI